MKKNKEEKEILLWEVVLGLAVLVRIAHYVGGEDAKNIFLKNYLNENRR